MDKKKEIVDLSPQNAEYAQKIQQARSVQHPVGGAQMPKMPNFAQAQEAGDRYSGVQNRPQQRAQGMATLLTPEQQQSLQASGQAHQGVGAAYAVNQPALKKMAQQAAPGSYQNPPRPEGAGISPQTAEQLAAVAQANTPEAPPAAPNADEMKKSIDDIEDEYFDFDEFGNKVKNILANKERRESIEGRCEPMDLMDLLVNKEVRQVVPIIPGKYYPTFRSVGGDEDLEVKRILSKETTNSPSYLLAKMTLMNLTCALYALNGKVLASHQDKEGDFDGEAFKAKYKSLIKYPLQVLTDLAVNYTWFDRRVRSLIAIEPIKDF